MDTTQTVAEQIIAQYLNTGRTPRHDLLCRVHYPDVMDVYDEISSEIGIGYAEDFCDAWVNLLGDR